MSSAASLDHSDRSTSTKHQETTFVPEFAWVPSDIRVSLSLCGAFEMAFPVEGGAAVTSGQNCVRHVLGCRA